MSATATHPLSLPRCYRARLAAHRMAAPRIVVRDAELQPPACTPARAVGAVLGDVVVLEQACGASTCDTIFSVASISKLVLAVVALQCAERGELSLDENVNARLPCRAAHPAHPGAPITPRMLLRHISGLADDESALHVGPWRTAGADCPVLISDYVAARMRDGGAPWYAEKPGDAPYHYSNLGMCVLALYVETCAGASVAALARQRVFAPLGMHRTSFTLAEAQRMPGAALASPHGPGGVDLGLYGAAEWPAAGLRSTVRDLLLFARQFTGSSCTLLSPASLAEMLPADFVRGLAWWGRDASYGDERGGVWTHGGFMDGVRSHLYYWPRQRLGVVLLQNGEGSYDSAVDAVKRALVDAAATLDPDGSLALADILDDSDDEEESDDDDA